MLAKNILTIISCLLFQAFNAQTFVNGNFEDNFADGIDQINLSNADCNAKLPGVTSFGSYGDVDIIKSSSYGGSGAQNGTWYIAITGGGTDIVALALSTSLVEGKSYSISFYDRQASGYHVSPIQIGLSNSNTDFGTVVHTTSELAVANTWSQRTFTFVAPNNGRFITVQMINGGISEWVNIDNFVFNNNKCGGPLKILASAASVELGVSATFTVQGGVNYSWSSAATLSSATASIVTATPNENVVYTVTSIQKGCEPLTATVSINVIIPKKEEPKDSVVAIKKDSIIIEKKHVDSVKTLVHKKIVHRRKLNGRKIVIQETLTVSNSSVKLLLWDKNRVDGDQISVYLNGELIIENLTVTKTKQEIFLNLEPGKNVIVMHALNLGLVPPNTAAISINDGVKNKLTTVISDLKKSGALELIYDPMTYTLK